MSTPSLSFDDPFDPLANPIQLRQFQGASTRSSDYTTSSTDSFESSRSYAGLTGESTGNPLSQSVTPDTRDLPTQISAERSAAILYALDKGLSRPNPFTPDIIEENASMSDLTGGLVGSSYGRAGNNGGSKAQTGPVPVGSPSSAAGIKGPREIMRERNAREAQRRADQEAKEALELQRAEEERNSLAIENRRMAERRNLATDSMQRSDARGGSANVGKPSGSSAIPTAQAQARMPGRHGVSVDNTLGSSRPSRETSTGQSRQARTQEVPKVSSARPESGPANPQADSEIPRSEAASSTRRATRSSFPHAFERWESLSAHWEGLTSYWVRRLEANSQEVGENALMQQMSRQITDLTAAGANLFHAVVELQRLRASSERKFTRWFYETRNQEERFLEKHAIQEKALQEERNGRTKAIEEAVAVALADQAEKFDNQRVMKEMKRELMIAREEARRAWEELGRREQEERERTLSLRDGQPTLVGGVQVVPMMQGVTSRHNSARPTTRDGPQPSGERPVGGVGGGQPQYTHAQQENIGDSYSPPSRTTASSARPVNTPTSFAQYPNATDQSMSPAAAAFYQQHPVPVRREDPTGREQHDRSYGPSEPVTEEEYVIDAQGQYPLDSQGNKIRYRSDSNLESVEEYEPREDVEQGQTYRSQYAQSSGVGYASGPSGLASRMAPSPPEDEYTGEGYPDWTHHHPTRLSDVVEEDERSRTSASQLSHH